MLGGGGGGKKRKGLPVTGLEESIRKKKKKRGIGFLSGIAQAVQGKKKKGRGTSEDNPAESVITRGGGMRSTPTSLETTWGKKKKKKEEREVLSLFKARRKGRKKKETGCLRV